MSRPAWTDAYLTDDQMANIERPYSFWMILLHKSAVSAHAHHVASRLHGFTLGRDDDKVSIFPSVASLASDIKRSATVVRAALHELKECGWVVLEARWSAPGDRSSWLISLTWPPTAAKANMQAGVAADLCGKKRSAKKGGTCTRRSGFGTATPGIGPCIHHGGPPPSRDEVPPSLGEVPPAAGEAPPLARRGTPLRQTRGSSLPESTTEGTTEYMTEAIARTSASGDDEIEFEPLHDEADHVS